MYCWCLIKITPKIDNIINWNKYESTKELLCDGFKSFVFRLRTSFVTCHIYQLRHHIMRHMSWSSTPWTSIPTKINQRKLIIVYGHEYLWLCKRARSMFTQKKEFSFTTNSRGKNISNSVWRKSRADKFWVFNNDSTSLLKSKILWLTPPPRQTSKIVKV